MACTGCERIYQLRIYVYSLPVTITLGLDVHGGKKKKPYERYEGGYEQYATELVIPRLICESHHELDANNANFFLDRRTDWALPESLFDLLGAEEIGQSQ